MDHQILWHLLARDTTSSPSPFPFLVQKSLLLLLEGKSHPGTHPKLSPHFLSDSPTGSGSAHSPAPSSGLLPRLHLHTYMPVHTPLLLLYTPVHTPLLLLDYSLSQFLRDPQPPPAWRPPHAMSPLHGIPLPILSLSQPLPCHASHFNLIKIFISQRNLP